MSKNTFNGRSTSTNYRRSGIYTDSSKNMRFTGGSSFKKGSSGGYYYGSRKKSMATRVGIIFIALALVLGVVAGVRAIASGSVASDYAQAQQELEQQTELQTSLEKENKALRTKLSSMKESIDAYDEYKATH